MQRYKGKNYDQSAVVDWIDRLPSQEVDKNSTAPLSHQPAVDIVRGASRFCPGIHPGTDS